MLMPRCDWTLNFLSLNHITEISHTSKLHLCCFRVKYEENMVNSEKAMSSNLRTLRRTLVALDCVFVGTSCTPLPYKHLVALLAMQPILVHMSKDSNGKFSFNPISVNLLTEVFKLVFAIGTLFVTHDSGKRQTHFISSPKRFLREAYHNRLLMIPACLYAINNYLKFLMQLHFNPTTTKMLGNLKVCF